MSLAEATLGVDEFERQDFEKSSSRARSASDYQRSFILREAGMQPFDYDTDDLDEALEVFAYPSGRDLEALNSKARTTEKVNASLDNLGQVVKQLPLVSLFFTVISVAMFVLFAIKGPYAYIFPATFGMLGFGALYVISRHVIRGAATL